MIIMDYILENSIIYLEMYIDNEIYYLFISRPQIYFKNKATMENFDQATKGIKYCIHIYIYIYLFDNIFFMIINTHLLILFSVL
jgi:hypothetical protein